jgi:hypothetical protein
MKRLIATIACLVTTALACNYSRSPTVIVSGPQVTVASSTATPANVPVGTPMVEPTKVNQLPTPAAGELAVAYVKAGNLSIWSHCQSRQLTQKGEVHRPRISSDGKVIAYLQPADDFHLEIWAIDASGENEHRIVSVADLDTIGGGVRDPSALAVNPYQFAWLPGTHRLAYNTQQIFQGPGLSLLNDLNLVDADTLQTTNLLLSGWGGAYVFSPDSSQVAISQPDKIFLANADGSDYRTIFDYPAVTTYSEYRYYASPVWAADGKSLRLALPPVDPLATPGQPTGLWRISQDGSPPVQMGAVSAVPFFEQPVEFSPDLRRVAFLREAGQPIENLRELHLAASDGTGDWLYAKGPSIRFLGWSPDASHFAYTLGEEQELWLGSLEEAPKLLRGGINGVQDLRWVDASRFLLWQANVGGFELVLANLKGGMLLLDAIVGAPEFDFTN